MSRILVVDDEPSCRGPLAKLLELEGFEVDTAEDGLVAIERLRDRRPDIIVLDLLMPRMDGVQFLEELRKDPSYDRLPILLVTGQHDAKLQSRAVSLGVREYLFKAATPFMKLLGILHKHLAEEASPAAPAAAPPPAKPARSRKAERDQERGGGAGSNGEAERERPAGRHDVRSPKMKHG